MSVHRNIIERLKLYPKHYSFQSQSQSQSQKCFIAIQEKVYIDQNNKKPIRAYLSHSFENIIA